MRTPILSLLFLFSFATASDAQFVERHALSADGARQVAEAAREVAVSNGWNVAIAVVDAGGDLIHFERIDGTQPASTDIAIEKARTAARFKRSTRLFQEGVEEGRSTLLMLDLNPFEGGLPILYDGDVVAAIGVSGATPEQDGIVADAGVAAVRQE